MELHDEAARYHFSNEVYPGGLVSRSVRRIQIRYRDNIFGS